MSHSLFPFCVDQCFTSSWLNLRRHSAHFSNRLTVILDTFLHPKTFLWETLIMRLQSIIRVYREFHTHSLLLFLCAGGPWRTVGLCEESYLCHRIWNLILGCIWQLADMVGVTVLKCNKPVNLRWTWQAVWAVHIILIGSGLVLFYSLWVNNVCLIPRRIPVDVSVLSIVFECFENWWLLYHVHSLICVLNSESQARLQQIPSNMAQMSPQGWCD